MGPEPQGQPFGRYRLLSLIGKGGMGEIYLAVGPGVAGVEKRIAIKKLLPTLVDEPGFVARFLDEARLVIDLCHGNIVPVFEVGQVGREYFLAMEYVDGFHLKQVEEAAGARGEPVPVGLALYIAHEVARGLDYAHRKTDANGQPLHVIHRDISPHNVLVGKAGEVKLVDFGIAKAAGQSQKTRTGGLVGKFAYISPEQAMGLPLDARSDQFSLGVVLHELLTGSPLFEGESDPAVLRKVQDAVVSAPSLKRPELPELLDLLVMKMLARDPAGRFDSLGEVARALGQLRYALAPAEAGDLAAFLARVAPSRQKVTSLDALLAAGPDRLPPPRAMTASLQPEQVDDLWTPTLPPPSPARWAVPLALGCAVLGFVLRPVASSQAAVAAPVEKAADKAQDRPPATPTPTSVLSPDRADKPPEKAPDKPVDKAPAPLHLRHAPGPDKPDKPDKPREKVPETPPIPREGGFLSLRVNPWGEVFVDGERLGETSALIKHPLPPGTHQVTVKNGPLGREQHLEVNIEPGATEVRRVDLSGT
jgi:serine/threonine-protein kinase